MATTLRGRWMPTVGLIPARWIILGWWLFLGAVTLSIVLLPRLKFVFRHDELHYSLSTFTALAASLVAFAALARHAVQRYRFDLYLGAAFLCIAVSRIWFGLIVQFSTEPSIANIDALLYGWTMTRWVAVVLLLVGIAGSQRSTKSFRQTLALVALLMALVAGADVVLWHWRAELPALLEPEALAALTVGGSTTLVLHGQTPLGIGLQLVVTSLWIVLALRLSVGARHQHEMMPALALITAAVGQVHFAFYPAAYTPIISTADGLSLVAYLIFLVYLAHRHADDARKLNRQYRRAAALTALSQANPAKRDRPLVLETARRTAQAVAPKATVLMVTGQHEPPLMSQQPGLLQSVYPIAAEGVSYGAIVVRSARTRPPSPDSSDFLQTVANQTGQLLRAIDLYTELADAAVREERMQLARELHDGLAQDLAVLRLSLDDANEQLRQYVDRALSEARYAITLLRGQPVIAEDFLKALERQSEELSRRFNCEVHVDHEGGIPSLSVNAQMALQRIAGEAVINAGKHARASQIIVQLRQTAEGFLLSITDNGTGFDASHNPPPDRFGLLGMRERVQALGGQIELVARLGQGSTVAVLLPCKRDEGQ